jgi:mono/diheme cytochrome c family protein/glucose/arabinose dehydrogenase
MTRLPPFVLFGFALAIGMTLAGRGPDVQAQGATAPAAQPSPAGGRADGSGQPQGGQAPGAGRGRRGTPSASALDDPANANADFSPKPPVLPLRPEEQVSQFWLPAGYRLEPVLADPLIEDPAQIVFDGNGRMFLVELRGYFQTPDGIDLIPHESRISMHEDRDRDGVFERHTVFVDDMVFPRFALPWGAGAILTMETNTDEIWKYSDTDGDGTADTREIFAPNFGRAGTMESQQSSLFWAMDNWLYSTVNAYRIRWTPNGILREPTGPNGAQWGITQDNHGKVHFQGGASGMPGYFQFPVHYGNFAAPDQFEPDLNVLWGAPILIGDIMQGLPWTRQPDGSLIYATAGAGNHIYRGDRLPEDLVGDYLYGEVVGRIVRRFRPVRTEGLTQMRNVHTRSEFIRSLDPLFRPVSIVTGPDGTIYIADMYRGIIEGAQWARTGTYLRAKIEQYGLDRIVNGRGRVWRLTYDGIEPDRTPPRMLDETPAQLVAHLAHPNGWWRDTAQQLLVLASDTSVVPALEILARSSSGQPAGVRSAASPAQASGKGGTQLARIHALWTLEGLGALAPSLVRALFADPDPSLRVQAIRASETLYKAGDKSFAADYRALTRDSDADVVIQAVLTLNVLKVADSSAAVSAAMSANPARGVQFVADRILNPPTAGRGGGAGSLTPEETGILERGSVGYAEICFACHGDDGRGTPDPSAPGSTTAPSLSGSARVTGHRDYVVKAILYGLTGPIDGRSYAEVMVPLGANRDEWIADVASYVRNSFGNSGSLVTPADVARVRAATAARRTPWTVEELEASLPRPLVPDESWRVTASHDAQPPPAANPAGGFSMEVRATGALTHLGWTTGVPQQAGMWLQVELPRPVSLVEIQFTSSTIGGGRGGPPPDSTYPRSYRVQVSDDGTNWSAPIAEGSGAPGLAAITVPPVTARFVRVTQTAGMDDAPPWSMRMLRLFEEP